MTVCQVCGGRGGFAKTVPGISREIEGWNNSGGPDGNVTGANVPVVAQEQCEACWGEAQRCLLCCGIGRIRCPHCSGTGRVKCATCQGFPPC